MRKYTMTSLSLTEEERERADKLAKKGFTIIGIFRNGIKVCEKESERKKK